MQVKKKKNLLLFISFSTFSQKINILLFFYFSFFLSYFLLFALNSYKVRVEYRQVPSQIFLER